MIDVRSSVQDKYDVASNQRLHKHQVFFPKLNLKGMYRELVVVVTVIFENIEQKQFARRLSFSLSRVLRQISKLRGIKPINRIVYKRGYSGLASSSKTHCPEIDSRR